MTSTDVTWDRFDDLDWPPLPDPVQDRLDHLADREDLARRLLERALCLAARTDDRQREAGPALRLALRLHRRAEQAAAELDYCTTDLERMDGR